MGDDIDVVVVHDADVDERAAVDLLNHFLFHTADNGDPLRGQHDEAGPYPRAVPPLARVHHGSYTGPIAGMLQAVVAHLPWTRPAAACVIVLADMEDAEIPVTVCPASATPDPEVLAETLRAWACGLDTTALGVLLGSELPGVREYALTNLVPRLQAC
jgi:hypothetical protein